MNVCMYHKIPILFLIYFWHTLTLEETYNIHYFNDCILVLVLIAEKKVFNNIIKIIFIIRTNIKIKFLSC